MPTLDEEGFAIQEYQGKQVRSNFWNQISPRLQDELEKVDGFSTAIGEWYYYVKEITKGDGFSSYYVVYKNPNYKKLLEPSHRPMEEEEEEEKQQEEEPEHHSMHQVIKETPSMYIATTEQQKVANAELPSNPELLYLAGDSINIPRSLLEKYVSIMVIKKSVNIQIPEMYDLIKTFNNTDATILGISRKKYSTVTVRDVFGTT